MGVTPETAACSRCQTALPSYEQDAPCTAGYYVVTDGYWSRFANPGELLLCDTCMWSDPLYRAERGAAALPTAEDPKP